VEDVDFGLKPDLVGISLMTPTALRGYEIADTFRRAKVPVVLGGMHVFFMPEEAAEHADALVIGEAEYTWNELLDDFLAGRMQPRYQSQKLHDLVGLPRPRLDLLRPGAYSFTNLVETGRGCPHRCSYCAVSAFWGQRFRFRPIDEVVEEIRSMPPGDVTFIDDNIFGHTNRAKALFEALIPLKRRWMGQGDLRVSRDPELLDLARRSGCGWIFLGIESTSVDNLKSVNKDRINRAEDYEQSIATIRRAGIRIMGSFMFGLDNDDEGVFDRTVQFCISNRLEGANFYLFTPLPGTQLFFDMKRDERILHYNWSRYDTNHVVFKPAHMSPTTLLEGYIRTYRSFYSIGSIARRALGIRHHVAQTLALNVGRRINFRYFEEGCRM
jgi:radical SAM superfamily enzyme YgiQ (UPF0313 family)